VAAPGARQIDSPEEQPNSAGSEPAARKTTHIKVGAKATLRGVAWRVGERSESDLQRMMIAIFRANPAAFDGNINRLHRGAVLTIPSHAELAAISKADAKREIHAQMTAWRSSTRTVTAATTTSPATPLATMPGPASSATTASSAATAAGAAPAVVDTTPLANAARQPAATEAEALSRRVQSLEKELSELKGTLDSERDQLVDLRQLAASAEKSAAVADSPHPVQAPQTAQAPQAVRAQRTVPAPQAAAVRPAQPKAGYAAGIPIIAGIGLLGAALAGLYLGFRRRVATVKDSGSHRDPGAADALSALSNVPPEEAPAFAQVDMQGYAPEPKPQAAPEIAQAELTPAADSNDATHPMLPIITSIGPAGRSESAAAQEPTVNMHVGTVNLRMDPTRLDYNLVDLDQTAQHVQMPSVLNENAVVKERRTNLADVLKLAIEREPDRHDLRMKLLELYYSAATTNRRAFLDVVQKYTRDRGNLAPEQWDKIAYMGRQIAAENPLFTEPEAAADDDLADCA
jgi:pilus assembly protein FimV